MSDMTNMPKKPGFAAKAPLLPALRERLTPWEAQVIDHAWREAERAARNMANAGAGITRRLHDGGGLSTSTLTAHGDGIPLSVAAHLTVRLAEYNSRVEHAAHRISMEDRNADR